MTRVKGGTVARERRKKVLKLAKGYFGSKHRVFRTAHEQVMHSGVYAFRDRRQNKRNFRKLWIVRINAACRENDISYSKFINGLMKSGLVINRKMLSEIAIDDKAYFAELVTIAKDALAGKEYKPKEVKLEKKAEVKKVTTEKETSKEGDKEPSVEVKKPTKNIAEKKPTPKKTAVATKTEKTPAPKKTAETTKVEKKSAPKKSTTKTSTKETK